VKGVLATLALIGLAALAAFALMSGRRLRGEPRAPSEPPAASQPGPLSAPIPVVDPALPTAAVSAEIPSRAGVPVLDAVPDPPPPPPPPAVEGPAIVADPPPILPAPIGPPAPPAAPTAIAAAASPDAGLRERPLENLGPPPVPSVDPRPFAEAHWQGLEAIPKTPTIAKMLRVPANVEGVILDDVTLPADLQGFQAGDVVTAVDGVPTPDLLSFIRATDRIRDAKKVAIDFVRAGTARRIEIVALFERLGTANGETPPMIPANAIRPHPYMGPCVNCHRIGTVGNLAIDQGDNPRKPLGPVRVDGPVPHRDRGPCATCHPIIP
jgi:hypothetical protein